MNLPTFVVGAIVLLVILSVVITEIRNRKKGKSACSCGGDCGACGMNCSCRPQK